MTDYVISSAGVAHRPDCPYVPLIVPPAQPKARAMTCRVCMPVHHAPVYRRTGLGWPDSGRFRIGLRGRPVGDGTGLVVR